jgi:hypothetical protein
MGQRRLLDNQWRRVHEEGGFFFFERPGMVDREEGDGKPLGRHGNKTRWDRDFNLKFIAGKGYAHVVMNN